LKTFQYALTVAVSLWEERCQYLLCRPTCRQYGIGE
jgi:hypothetical protein